MQQYKTDKQQKYKGKTTGNGKKWDNPIPSLVGDVIE